MKAEIITIGDEILIGQIVDTNSAWLASELTTLGFTVSQMRSISDNAAAITETLDSSLQNNHLTIITGGLGPTKDDITKTTLCSYFNTNLVFNEVAFADVESFVAQRGAKMNTLNKDQALFPKAAKILRNRQGTAPGIWFEKEGRVVISLPGVPWEMKGIYTQEIEEKLSAAFKLPVNFYQTLMITGLGESQLALLIEDWENKLPENFSLAYLPSPGLIRLRIGIKGTNKEYLQSLVTNEIQKLHKIIPQYIISDTEAGIHEIVFKHLKYNNLSLSTAESCTGGAIASLITSLPGSSAIFMGSVIAYANETKANILGVPPTLIEEYGAVSKQVVESMAKGAKNKLNTHYAIATSGIAGPDGGSEEKPVGTVWIAVASDENVVSKKFIFGKEREINIKRATIAALNMLREILIEKI